MKITNITFSVFLSFCILFGGISFGQSVDKYPYSRNVLLPNLTQEKNIQVELTKELLKELNIKLRNIFLVDNENTKVPYSIFRKNAERIRNLNVLEVSSNRFGKKEELVDNDILTSFKFNPTDGIEKNKPATILIDLLHPVFVTRVNVFNTAGDQITTVSIKGGMEKDSLKTIIGKRDYKYQYDFNSNKIQFLELSLWGRGLNIDDIRVYQDRESLIQFTAKPNNKYKLLYGDRSNKMVTFASITGDPFVITQLATLGTKQFNDVFPVDMDNDEIRIKQDNCPFIKNQNQNDRDQDGIGDACDNAKDIRNSDQSDIDGDKIGDVEDNCKLTFNPDQLDSDKDGMGDGCDSAYTPAENQFFSQLSPFTVIISLLALLGFFLLFQAKRITNKK